MDVFQLRQAAVDQYRDYVAAFVNIRDERLGRFVPHRLKEGELWSETALQLNPAYEQAETLGQLTARGVTRNETADCFGYGLRLHRHLLVGGGNMNFYIVK